MALTRHMGMLIIMTMPTKNVYVAEADLPMFDRAAELAGGMSAAVALGLRLYIEKKEREVDGFKKIEVEVDDGPLVLKKRFQGRRLLRLERKVDLRILAFEVYKTAKGNLAVYHRDDPDWSRLSGGDNDAVWANPITWSSSFYNTHGKGLDVYPDLEAMSGKVPDEVVSAVQRALETPAVEDLDI